MSDRISQDKTHRSQPRLLSQERVRPVGAPEPQRAATGKEGIGTDPAQKNQKPKGQVLRGQTPTGLTARGGPGRQTRTGPWVSPDPVVMPAQSHLGPVHHPSQRALLQDKAACPTPSAPTAVRTGPQARIVLVAVGLFTCLPSLEDCKFLKGQDPRLTQLYTLSVQSQQMFTRCLMNE